MYRKNIIRHEKRPDDYRVFGGGGGIRTPDTAGMNRML